MVLLPAMGACLCMEPDGAQVEVLWYGPCAELYLAGAVKVFGEGLYLFLS